VYAFSQVLADVTGIQTYEALIINDVIILSSFCTSIVARKESGDLVHVRNLDFDRPELLQSLVSKV
jgi:hypothetical protein